MPTFELKKVRRTDRHQIDYGQYLLLQRKRKALAQPEMRAEFVDFGLNFAWPTNVVSLDRMVRIKILLHRDSTEIVVIAVRLCVDLFVRVVLLDDLHGVQ